MPSLITTFYSYETPEQLIPIDSPEMSRKVLAVQRPQYRTVAFYTFRNGHNTNTLPFPYVIFIPGRGWQRPFVFFANKWEGLETKLCFPPLPNIYDDCTLCTRTILLREGADCHHLEDIITSFWNDIFCDNYDWRGPQTVNDQMWTSQMSLEEVMQISWCRAYPDSELKNLGELLDKLRWGITR